VSGLPEDRCVRAGTTTEAVVRNWRDAPAIIRRYWPYSLIVALVSGGFAWWAAGDLVAGALTAFLVFVGGLVAGWGLEPFLPPDRQVIRSVR
jgi:uncharacterized membrane protein YbaN (DUF454 family)